MALLFHDPDFSVGHLHVERSQNRNSTDFFCRALSRMAPLR
ncbi:MAG: hypothetical protein JWN14_2560 [Chthonomonadales bacterium]|nr:hypothetical protein [Chthonomonadales bacterium]